MAEPALLGDLRERPDGSFDGWCWVPGRPQERLIVDLLVNDTLAISMVAAIFRRDLQTRGYGDGRHGFVLRLPANTEGLDSEALITARERRSGHIFGRVLRAAPAVSAPGGPALDRVERQVDALWQDLDSARPPPEAERPSQRLRSAFGTLAGRLRAQAGRAPWPDGPPIVLPAPVSPALTVAFVARAAEAAFARIAALAPGLALARAELLVIDPGIDPEVALLSSRVRNLRMLRDGAAAGVIAACNLALAHGAGERRLWLGDTVATPSAAALLALARALAKAPPALWLGPEAAISFADVDAPLPPAVSLPARFGMALCVDRAVFAELGPLDPGFGAAHGLAYADLALRARLLGVDLRAVMEPEPPTGAAVEFAPASTAAWALFRSRWGALDPLIAGA